MSIKLTQSPLICGVSATQKESNHILITVEGARPTTTTKRKPLNLVLAIDCSSSMVGSKIDTVKKAACAFVDKLAATDRIGVVSFANHVKEVWPLDLLEDRAGIKRAIDNLKASGSTALFPGWEASVGMLEAIGGRILLLSDGEANIGLTAPDAISEKVKEAKAKDIATSTLGVGSDYNEDLMEAMALSGEGNYFFVEKPDQLDEILTLELAGVQARIGTDAVLELTEESNTEIIKAIKPNILSKNKIKLGSILSGIPIHVLLEIATAPSSTDVKVLTVKLQYKDADSKTNVEATNTLQLPAIDNEWLEVQQDPSVKERVAAAKAEELREAAVLEAEKGNKEASMAYLSEASSVFAQMPLTSYISGELGMLNAVTSKVEAGEYANATKLSKAMCYSRTSSLVRDYLAETYSEKKTDEGNNK